MVETSPPFAELPPDRRAEAMMRHNVLRPHLEESVPLASVAEETDTPLRTLQRWLARYRWQGLAVWRDRYELIHRHRAPGPNAL